MQDPFSQQDTEMEEASPNISFPHVRQLIPVYKVQNVINRGERKNKTGQGQGEVKPSPKTNPKCSSGFHSPSPFPMYWLSFCGCYLLLLLRQTAHFVPTSHLSSL